MVQKSLMSFGHMILMQEPESQVSWATRAGMGTCSFPQTGSSLPPCIALFRAT